MLVAKHFREAFMYSLKVHGKVNIPRVEEDSSFEDKPHPDHYLHSGALPGECSPV